MPSDKDLAPGDNNLFDNYGNVVLSDSASLSCGGALYAEASLGIGGIIMESGSSLTLNNNSSAYFCNIVGKGKSKINVNDGSHLEVNGTTNLESSDIINFNSTGFIQFFNESGGIFNLNGSSNVDIFGSASNSNVNFKKIHLQH